VEAAVSAAGLTKCAGVTPAATGEPEKENAGCRSCDFHPAFFLVDVQQRLNCALSVVFL
jgi:hypothetical protein